MFSGIVVAQGQVVAKQQRAGHDYRLQLAAPSNPQGKPIRPGDSVAVNGVCLTVVECSESGVWSFDVSAETARCTTLANVHINDWLNLEPALCLGDRLNGHWVTGHVDCLVVVRECNPQGDSLHLQLEVPDEFMPYIAVKGSVCLDGVSLTVTRVHANTFAVNVIPYTAEHTHFSSLTTGRAMNLEVDIVARYIHRLSHALQTE